MSDKRNNDGGPAFPVTPTDRSGQIGETMYGMTLRDWFAGQALAGIIYSLKERGITERDIPKMARDCYYVADEMLCQRAKARP